MMAKHNLVLTENVAKNLAFKHNILTLLVKGQEEHLARKTPASVW